MSAGTRERQRTRHARRALASAAAVLVAAAIALLPATAASAHDYLVSSTPAAGSTITTAPDRISLTFDDVVIDLGGSGAIVQVTDAAGGHFETTCPTVDGRTVSTPVALGGAGTYTVTWRIVSADGHPVSDSIRFDYAPSAGAVAARPQATPPACGSGAQGSGALTATASPAATGSSSLNPAPIIAVGAGIVAAAVIAVVLILVLSRRRRTE